MTEKRKWRPGESKVKLESPKQEVLPPSGNYEVAHGGGGPTDAGWHKIDAALRCFKEYQFREVRGLRVPAPQTPDYFATGIGFHAGRARWFTDKFDMTSKGWGRIELAVEEEFEKQKLPISVDAKQFTMKILKEYVEYWSLQPKPTPIVAEHLIGPAPLQPGDPFALWRTARIDDASYYPDALNGLCIGEAKTTSTTINDCINEYTLHGQPSLQYVLWKMAEQGETKYGPLKGVMLDIVQKGYGKEKCKFARHLVAWYIKNLRMIMRAIPAIDWNTDVPRNITSCTRLIGKQRVACHFRDLCLHGKTASIKYIMRDGKSLLSFKPSEEFVSLPWD